MVPDIFHRDFKPIPYWWEAYTPATGDLVDLPRAARVAIVGGGYAGLSTALELAKHGIDAVVLEAGELGFGSPGGAPPSSPSGLNACCPTRRTPLA
jgi:NADPH-dependent 2,4-dienoyl-CoA reductase/sulfur reductase-like enzyme